MGRSLSGCIILLFCSACTIYSQPSNPCTNHIIINDTTMDVSYTALNIHGFVVPGYDAWYRFTSTGQGILTTSCPDGNQCGTSSQAWMNDTMPGVSEKPKHVKLCIRQTECCSRQTLVEVKNCNTFAVYKLLPMPPTSQYCFDKSSTLLSSVTTSAPHTTTKIDSTTTDKSSALLSSVTTSTPQTTRKIYSAKSSTMMYHVTTSMAQPTTHTQPPWTTSQPTTPQSVTSSTPQTTSQTRHPKTTSPSTTSQPVTTPTPQTTTQIRPSVTTTTPTMSQPVTTSTPQTATQTQPLAANNSGLTIEEITGIASGAIILALACAIAVLVVQIKRHYRRRKASVTDSMKGIGNPMYDGHTRDVGRNANVRFSRDSLPMTHY